jgi:glutamyl-tRNA reductase
MEICLYKDNNGKCKLRKIDCIEIDCIDRIIKIGQEVVNKSIYSADEIVDVRDVSIFLDQNTTTIISKMKKLMKTGELSKQEVERFIVEENKSKKREKVLKLLKEFKTYL